ncbi:unnamed protein product [Arctogadus glacialis]
MACNESSPAPAGGESEIRVTVLTLTALQGRTYNNVQCMCTFACAGIRVFLPNLFPHQWRCILRVKKFLKV